MLQVHESSVFNCKTPSFVKKTDKYDGLWIMAHSPSFEAESVQSSLHPSHGGTNTTRFMVVSRAKQAKGSWPASGKPSWSAS